MSRYRLRGNAMILEDGDKVLVAHRRLFAEDQPRFFVGVVDRYEDGIARVTGYSWVREQLRGELERKADQRTKIVSVVSGSILLYRLPSGVDIEHLEIEHGPHQEVVLTDGREFHMDLTDRRKQAA